MVASSILTPQSGSLYFHIPFCNKKCGYCHFYVIPNKSHFHQLYMEALKLEWERAPRFESVVSLYFGGGTPYLLGAKNFEKILDWVSPLDDVEITLEANPEDVTLEEMRALRSLGINRISMGVQTLDSSLLSKLTRHHTAEQAIRAVEKTAEAGFENISVDLMYDLPGQSFHSWEQTVNRACSLPITHISLYNLTIEPHTSFYKQRERLKKHLPNDDESLKMLNYATFTLPCRGFERYEISAFAKSGLYSKHNTGYWKARPFLGLGPSAFSYFKGARFQNIANINRYAEALKKGKSPVDFYEKLSLDTSRRELLAIRLRLLEGVEIWPEELEAVYQELRKEELVERCEKGVRLTSKGLLFHETVAEKVLSH